MSGWSDAQVREALGLAGAEAGPLYTGVSTDTRSLAAGHLFVALRGENHDAHEFLAEAATRGATGAVVDHVPGSAPDGMVYYEVHDTLVALGDLARHRRRRLVARVCAVTGTNGKTTTKEMTRAVLGTRYRVHATVGNLNNLVGTPLTLLTTPDDAEMIVVEVGTNAPGEIARLRDVAEPDAAIITGVAEGHLEGLGSLEGVLLEKTALLENTGEDLAVVADTPASLPERARGIVGRLRVAGWTERADEDLRVADVRLDDDGRTSFRWGRRLVSLNYRGAHNARNALLALALGMEWGADPDDGVSALGQLEPTALRGEVIRIGNLRVIADCYNSNPASLSAAMDLLSGMPRRGGRVAVLGSMRELGPESAALHHRAAEAIAGTDVDLVVATGEFVPAFAGLAAALGDRLIVADDPLAAYPLLASRLTGDELVLLKGSRGVALERLIPMLQQDWSATGSEPAGSDSARRDG
jgi:UDP-N-acetylmuramoyl-tripeptide--D-alanyl-D-alanine ligase